MFAKLFRTPSVEPPQAKAPAGSCVYAIGDIHGRADLLADLHERIVRDAARRSARRKVVVYLGDYIDRGYESRQVIDLLLDRPLAAFERVHLIGNHEQSMLTFLDDLAIGPAWLQYGGLEALFSYGIVVDRGAGDEGARLAKAQKELRAKLPQRHLEFLKSLARMHIEGDYLFVHAGIRPGVPLERQDERDLLWIRDEFLASTADHGKVVVHGHSISERPELRRNRIGIDTGAFATGRLTGLVLEGTRQDIIDTGA
ncbi:MAG: serine/threonine protein phosphatase [Rhodospirillales bacterium]|nr:serine/threonine protein phosphatase [Rhodospirillales bacterium]